MSGSERSSKRVAQVEDADESDNPIEGTGRSAYAESVASPVKERSNTGRTRREKPRRESSSPQASGLTDSDSTVHPRERQYRDSREIPSPHRKALAISEQTLAMRPAAKHANTTPHLSYRSSDEAAYYGVPTTVTPATSRPRARTTQRPASYYGNPSRPPPSNAQFYARQPPPPPPAPMPTSYPPPSWGQAGPMGYPMASPMGPPPPRDYFTPAPQNLLARFGDSRPQSAMGHRHARNPLAYEDYDEQDPHIVRRPSRKSKDRMQMPPPPRPQSARPTSFGYRPPSTPARKIVGARFEDDELDRERELFHVSPLMPYDYPPPSAPRMRRPSIGAPSMSYDVGPYRTEVAGNNRRNSYKNSVSSNYSDFEAKLQEAAAYQQDVGGPSVPLTAEMLRKASKNGGSSRSTRSSGSHDESDYRQSATTRTTRSSNNEEDFTIRIKGVRSVEVGGAKMHCDDGAEINIASRPAVGYRGGSDRSSYIDPEDRRIEDRRPHRIERPPTRTRSGSQAGSFSRTPRYDTAPPLSHAPMPRYDNARYDQFGYPLPPYPPGNYI